MSLTDTFKKIREENSSYNQATGRSNQPVANSNTINRSVDQNGKRISGTGSLTNTFSRIRAGNETAGNLNFSGAGNNRRNDLFSRADSFLTKSNQDYVTGKWSVPKWYAEYDSIMKEIDEYADTMEPGQANGLRAALQQTKDRMMPERKEIRGYNSFLNTTGNPVQPYNLVNSRGRGTSVITDLNDLNNQNQQTLDIRNPLQRQYGQQILQNGLDNRQMQNESALREMNYYISKGAPLDQYSDNDLRSIANMNDYYLNRPYYREMTQAGLSMQQAKEYQNLTNDEERREYLRTNGVQEEQINNLLNARYRDPSQRVGLWDTTYAPDQLRNGQNSQASLNLLPATNPIVHTAESTTPSLEGERYSVDEYKEKYGITAPETSSGTIKADDEYLHEVAGMSDDEINTLMQKSTDDERRQYLMDLGMADAVITEILEGSQVQQNTYNPITDDRYYVGSTKKVTKELESRDWLRQYIPLTMNEDFEANSSHYDIDPEYIPDYRDSQARQDMSDDEKLGLFIASMNGNQKAYDFLHYVEGPNGEKLKYGNVYDDIGGQNEEFMTDDEVAIFNYLYNTEGLDSAMEYYRELDDRYLKSRASQAINAEYQAWTKEDPVGANFATTIFKPFIAFGSQIQQIYDLVTTGNINADDPRYAYLSAPETVRGTTTQMINDATGSDFWGNMFNAGMSVIDNVYGIGIGGNISKALGLTGSGAYKAQEAITLAIMGTDVAQMTTLDGIRNGMDVEDAALNGFAAASIEILTEKIGLDNLFESISLGRSGFITFATQALSEGAEEGMSHVLNNAWGAVYDNITGLDQSDWQRRMNVYILENGLAPSQQGEAFNAVFQEELKELGTDIMGGALSGGIMGGPVAVNNYFQNRSALGDILDEYKTDPFGNKIDLSGITEDANALRALASEGMHYDVDSDAYKQAAVIMNSLQAGQKVSMRQAEKLYNELIKIEAGLTEGAHAGANSWMQHTLAVQAANDSIQNQQNRDTVNRAIEEAIQNGGDPSTIPAEIHNYAENSGPITESLMSALGKDTLRELNTIAETNAETKKAKSAGAQQTANPERTERDSLAQNVNEQQIPDNIRPEEEANYMTGSGEPSGGLVARIAANYADNGRPAIAETLQGMNQNGMIPDDLYVEEMMAVYDAATYGQPMPNTSVLSPGMIMGAQLAAQQDQMMLNARIENQEQTSTQGDTEAQYNERIEQEEEQAEEEQAPAELEKTEEQIEADYDTLYDYAGRVSESNANNFGKAVSDNYAESMDVQAYLDGADAIYQQAAEGVRKNDIVIPAESRQYITRAVQNVIYEAAQEDIKGGATYVQQRNVPVSESSERVNSPSAAIQSQGVAGRAGSAARTGRITEGYRGPSEAYRRENEGTVTGRAAASNGRYSYHPTGQVATAKSLGLSTGTDQLSVQIVELDDTPEGREVLDIAKQNGKKIVLFAGNNLSFEGQQYGSRGVIQGDTIYVRADHPAFTPAQIALHEVTHPYFETNANSKINAITARLDALFGENFVNGQVLPAYRQAYKRTENGDLDTLIEIMCDVRGGMNIFHSMQSLLPATKENYNQFLTEGQKIVSEAVQETEQTGSGNQNFSRELDTEYMELAKNPEANRDALQRMVDDAAKAAGYTIKAYHATDEEFNVYDRGKLGNVTDQNANYVELAATAHVGFWFNSSPEISNATRQNNAKNSYLKINDPYEIGTVEALSNEIVDTYGEDYDELQDRFDNYDFSVVNDMGETYRESLEWRGYDGIVVENDEEFGGSSYVVFDSEQIKSADPVTYDDDGNVIPLSERFNTENKDIRFSEELTPQTRFDSLYTTLEDGRIKPTNIDALTTEDWKLIYKAVNKLGYGMRSVKDTREVYQYTADAGFNADQSAAIKAAYGVTNENKIVANPEREARAIKTFGTTGNFSEAGYLLRNGKMLDFSGKRDGGPSGVRYMDHREIQEVFDDNELPEEKTRYSNTPYMDAFISEGNIRLMDGHGVTIGEMEPTSQQYAMLKQFVNHVLKDGNYFYLDISNIDGKSIESRDYTSSDGADRIIRDIKAYYKNGELPYRSSLSAFYSQEVDPDAHFDKNMESIAKDLRKRVRQLERENRNLQRNYEYSQAQSELTAYTPESKAWRDMKSIISEKDAGAIAKDIIQTYSSTIKADEITADIQYWTTYLHTGRSNAFDRINRGLLGVARKIVENASVIIDHDGSDILRDIKQTKIKISPKVAGDIQDYNAWRKKYFGKMNVSTTSGVDITEYYNELNDRFGSLFPEDVNNATDQLLYLADFVDSFVPESQNPYSYDMAAATQAAALDLYNALVDAPVAEPTQADVQAGKAISRVQKKADASKQKALESAKKRTDRRIERMREQNKKRMQNLQRRSAEIRDRQINALKDHYREQAQNRRTRREESNARKQLLHLVQRLNRIKTTKANRMLIDDLIGNLDSVAMSLSAGKATSLLELQEWYESEKENNPDFVAHEDLIGRQLARLNQRHIKDMTIDEIRELTNALRTLENDIRTQNQLIAAQDNADIFEAGVQIMRDIENSFGTKKGLQRDLDNLIVQRTLSPVRFAHRLTGYVESNPLYQAVAGEDGLAGGQRKMLTYQYQAGQLFQEWLSDKQFMKWVTGKKSEILTYDITTADGKQEQIQLTPGMRMLLHLASKDQGWLMHMCGTDTMDGHRDGGGITLPNIKDYRNGKITDAYDDAKTVKITRSFLNKLSEDMTEKERKFADAISEYFNKMSKNAINEVSELLLGRSIAEVGDYLPISVDKNFLGKEYGAIKYDGTIEGMGNLKERQNSKKPVMIRDITDVLKQSIESTSKYVGLAIPIRNFNKLMGVTVGHYDADGNYRNFEGSVLQQISKKWGTKAQTYIENMISDLQMPNVSQDDLEKTFAKLRSHYAGAVLTWNLSVAMKQAASYPTAAAVVGGKALAKAMKDFGKVDLNLIAKYTPLQWYRTKGFSTTELGDIQNQNNFWANLPKGLNWIQGVDVLTTRKLWKAAEYYVQENNPELYKKGAGAKGQSDAYYQAVAEIYNQVIEETQPNYTALQRPDYLRSKSGITQTLMMFKTQPMQNFNILYDAIGNFRAKRAQFLNDQTNAEAQKAYQEAKKKLSRSITSQLAQLITFAAMTMLWNMIRRKREKYTDEEGNFDLGVLAQSMGKDVGSGVFGMLPFGADVWSLVSSIAFGDQYYGFESVTDSALGDLGNAVMKAWSLGDTLLESIKSGEPFDLTAQKKNLKSIAFAISKIAGIPLENVWNLGTAAYKRLGHDIWEDPYHADYWAIAWDDDPSKKKHEISDILYKAFADGNLEAFEDLRQILIDSGEWGTDAATPEEDVDNNVQKRWIENTAGGTKAQDAYDYLAGLEGEEYQRIYDQMINLGFDPDKISKGITNSKVAAITGTSSESKEIYPALYAQYENNRNEYVSWINQMIEAGVAEESIQSGLKKAYGSMVTGLGFSDVTVADVYQYLYDLYTSDQKAFKEAYQQMIDIGFTESAIKSGLETIMKQEQGVSNVKDLKKRFDAPQYVVPTWWTTMEEKKEQKEEAGKKLPKGQNAEAPKVKETVSTPESSWIGSIDYDESTQTLIVTTKGGRTYTHSGVSKETYEDFKNAPSKGRWYNAHF